MSLLNFAKRRFSANMCGSIGVEGKVQVQNGTVFLCQNSVRGASCQDRLGHRFSYHVNRGTEEDLRENSVYDFKIID